MKPKYLVRPEDFHIFDLDETNGCYRSWSTRNVTYSDSTRPNAMEHFTFEILTTNFNFFPIEEHQLNEYQDKNNNYTEYMVWLTRSDGHGGLKGGTYVEFLKTLKKT